MDRKRLVTVGAALGLWLFTISVARAESGSSRPEQCGAEICALIAEGRLTDLRWPDFTRYQEQIARFYEANSYQFAWVTDGVASARAREIAPVLRRADALGLRPEDYDGRRWATRILELDQHRMSQEALARFDLAFSVAVARYVSDLRHGRANPGVYRTSTAPLEEIVRSVWGEPDLGAVWQSLEPPYEGYRDTLKALEQYRTLERLDDGELLPVTNKPVEPGQAYGGAARLGRLLALLGDLPADVVPAGDVYDEALVAAVKRFQGRHGLESDGRIGKGTFAALNAPLSERVRQLEFTLERWRWLPREFTPSILVNIPEFKLRALDASHRVDMEMNVVVGAARRTQTPLLGEDLKYVVMRPYWNVPYSIQRHEIVPALEKDPAYLTKHGYEVVSQARQVVASREVTPELMTQLKSGDLWVRQQPGPKNSLGLVKFMFPNQENVYLHDTPSKSLFGRARRDFSHGCVRVADPSALAEWVLKEDEGWTRERIATSMQGGQSVQVNLKRPFPVRIVYQTAVVLENGEARFFEDIYGQDADLNRQINSIY